MGAITSLTLGPSWYDLYRDPDDLAGVRAVIDQHLAPGERLDWKALLAAETDLTTSYHFNSYQPGPDSDSAVFIFPYALERLHSREVTEVQGPVDLIPVRLTETAVRLDQDLGAGAIASIWPILDRWHTWNEPRRAEVERLAQTVERREATSHEATMAYCLWALVHMARLAAEYQVPVRVSDG